jgi:hypothetical protein
MLRRLGQPDAAEAAFERAAHLAATEKDRQFLVQQIEELADEAAGGACVRRQFSRESTRLAGLEAAPRPGARSGSRDRRV